MTHTHFNVINIQRKGLYDFYKLIKSQLGSISKYVKIDIIYLCYYIKQQNQNARRVSQISVGQGIESL